MNKIVLWTTQLMRPQVCGQTLCKDNCPFFDYLGISYKTHVGKEGKKKPSQTNNNILYQNSYHTTKTNNK